MRQQYTFCFNHYMEKMVVHLMLPSDCPLVENVFDVTMDLAQEVNVGSPLPLPRPLVLLQQTSKEHFCLVSLSHNCHL